MFYSVVSYLYSVILFLLLSCIQPDLLYTIFCFTFCIFDVLLHNLCVMATTFNFYPFCSLSLSLFLVLLYIYSTPFYVQFNSTTIILILFSYLLICLVYQNTLLPSLWWQGNSSILSAGTQNTKSLKFEVFSLSNLWFVQHFRLHFLVSIHLHHCIKVNYYSSFLFEKDAAAGGGGGGGGGRLITSSKELKWSLHYACLYASMITSTMTHRFTSNFGYNLKPILDPWNFFNDFLILHSYAIVNVLLGRYVLPEYSMFVCQKGYTITWKKFNK